MIGYYPKDKTRSVYHPFKLKKRFLPVDEAEQLNWSLQENTQWAELPATAQEKNSRQKSG